MSTATGKLSGRRHVGGNTASAGRNEQTPSSPSSPSSLSPSPATDPNGSSYGGDDSSSSPYDYVFGYGSIINTATHGQWLKNLGKDDNHNSGQKQEGGREKEDVTKNEKTSQSDDEKDDKKRNETTKSSSSSSSSAASLPGCRARILPSFGYSRGWTFRSSTGFTALGLVRHPPTSSSPSTDNGINGVLFRIPRSSIPDFDRREIGYDRVQISRQDIILFGEGNDEDNDKCNRETTDADADAAGGHLMGQELTTNVGNSRGEETTAKATTTKSTADTRNRETEDMPKTKQSNKDTAFQIFPNEKIWIYVPQESQIADEDHPILQSYVDTVLQGCLEWGGEEMGRQFVETTSHWSHYFLNDTPSSRRPWLYRKDYVLIDKILYDSADKTYFSERRHPEEFASAFLIRMMRGTWSLPKRNINFTGRDEEIRQMHSKLNSKHNDYTSNNNGVHSLQSDAQGKLPGEFRTGVQMLEVVGMGGVGKTQICSEYCYRYCPAWYGLAIWLNAQSAESISNSYRQFIADTTGADVKDKDTDEVVTEVKARLFRSNIPWLLVFDNLEDRSLLDKFVPHGGSCGHVLVTTRWAGTTRRTDDMTTLTFPHHDDGNSSLVMKLGCFTVNESVELLRRSAGEQNVRNTYSHGHAAEQLAEKLGHLPLALGMAAAYMRRCDVDCIEYLARYNASEEAPSRSSSTGPVGSGAQGKRRRRQQQPNKLGVQAVEASLSLSLNAIAKENSVALDALCLLSWLGPDDTTKPLMRSLFKTRKLLTLESRQRQSNLGTTRSSSSVVGKSQYSTPQYYALLGGSCALIACSVYYLTANDSPGKTTNQNKNLTQYLTRSLGVSLSSTAAVAAATVAYTVLSISSTTWQDRTSHDGKSLSQQNRHVSNNRQLGVKPPKRSTSFSSDEYELTDQIWTILKSFSILNVRDGKGSMHRLLCQVLRTSQDDLSRHQNLRICINVVQQMWDFKPEAVDTWQKSADMLEHLKAVVIHASKENACCGMALETSILARQGGMFSAMALNRFKEAQNSLEKSLEVLEGTRENGTRGGKHPNHDDEIERARAASLHELGRVYRYQGNFASSERALRQALELRNHLAANDKFAQREVADTLHELGVLESKKHNLEAAAKFLEESLDLRHLHQQEQEEGQQQHNSADSEAACASTLHQLAAVHVARKPPSLDDAEVLLLEALSLHMQIGQRAATLRQFARVAIRRGEFDKAERSLAQALELYVELYGKTLHINVAAVKFQQGALAFQREQLDQAWVYFLEALQARRHVYAYANGHHLEVAAVLHELGCVAFGQGRTAKAQEMLTDEKEILDQLYESSSQRQRIIQARLTNLTWLRKCAKARGNDQEAKRLVAERATLKQKLNDAIPDKISTDSVTRTLQREALLCRSLARKVALANDNDGQSSSSSSSSMTQLKKTLDKLGGVIERSPPSTLKESVVEFHQTVLDEFKSKNPNQQSILGVCDSLRDVLRENGVEVNDSLRRKSPQRK